MEKVPPIPENSFRITLTLMTAESRMDSVLLKALQGQSENKDLRIMTRSKLKALFNEGRIQIKGQRARPSSGLASGITYVDILGF